MRQSSITTATKFVACAISLFVASGAFAAESVKVETANTMMLFAREQSGADDRLYLRHFGPKIADEAGALALAVKRGPISSLGTDNPLAYSVFGESGRGLNRFGGLKVTHDDGTVTLDLIVEKLKRDGDALKVSWRDAVHDFRVIQTFRTRADADVVETWVELVNGEKGAVRISRMSSFSLVFPIRANDWHLMSLTGEWASEGEQNPVCEPERTLRYQIQHMVVCVERVSMDTKPGGTAGVRTLVPAEVVVGDGGIFLCPVSLK